MQKNIALRRRAFAAYRDAGEPAPDCRRIAARRSVSRGASRPRRRRLRTCWRACRRASARSSRRAPDRVDGADSSPVIGTPVIERARSRSTAAFVPSAAAVLRRRRIGKTIMPAMIDAHAHIGYMRDLTSGPQNYTRENIVDHLQRYAYFGVAAGQAMGSDFTDLPYQLRDELARRPHSGRGALPHRRTRPGAARRGAARQHAAFRLRASRPRPEARAAVGELAARGVDHRQDVGRRPRRRRAQAHPRSLRGDHRRGASARHARDGACHRARRREGAAAGRRRRLRPRVPGRGRRAARAGRRRGRRCSSCWRSAGRGGSCRRRGSIPCIRWCRRRCRPAQIARLQQRLASQTPEERERARAAWERMAAGIARLSAAGARIGVGTDGGGQLGDQFVGWTVHTEVENMVAAGMTPAQVLMAATRTGAGILGLDDLGDHRPGQERRFRRARRQPARRHHQHAADRTGLPARHGRSIARGSGRSGPASGATR